MLKVKRIQYKEKVAIWEIFSTEKPEKNESGGEAYRLYI
jgi:hypothetical protein